VTLLDLEVLARIFSALGIQGRLVLEAPIIDRAAPQRDAGHARCVGYVARSLRRAGFLVATEVEVGNGRWRGWIDVLAFDPRTGMLIVIEVKTELHDIGAEQRRFAAYEREAYAAGRRLGWAPRFHVGALAILRTDATDARIRANADLLLPAFPADASTFTAWLARPEAAPGSGRALVGIDPRGRGPRWALDARPDRRRRAPRYADYGAFVRSDPVRG
jgi:hypothetical protein